MSFLPHDRPGGGSLGNIEQVVEGVGSGAALTSNYGYDYAASGERLLYPAERSLSATSPVESIDIQLTPRVTPIFGWNVPWWATFFLVSMGITFAVGKFMGVQF